MAVDPALSSSLAIDSKSLESLKQQAKASPDKALRQAASQFEAVFMNMLMKSMRDTLSQDGLFDSQQTKMYTGMLDQQMAQKLSERGLGLADLMVKQLSRQTSSGKEGVQPDAVNKVQKALSDVKGAEAVEGKSAPQNFIDRLLPHAREAERKTGMPAQFILGQAALESGWGKREIAGQAGDSSHNLFGIKAGKGWTGKTVDVMTTEYVNGKAQKLVQKFRAYDSYADAFSDWAKLIGKNPRYAKVLEAGKESAAQFAQGLQQAGYATDPLYAAKLTKVINHQLMKQAFA
ncbi:MAG TPA: flagellar assembly peptidoglycan hydrolase FlgJ [Burkholderiales bacterium]|nr:flagellar assembly peptidoglycan hydrolase FlgJ [Burkholderiales bacterium]